MIQKNKSRKRALLKYLLSAPVFVLMLVLSSATVNKYPGNTPTVSTKNDKLPVFQQKDNKVFTVVEHEPTFPGGQNAFVKFLGQNMKYPALMKQKKVEGRAIISFIVEEDGSLSSMKILRDPGYGAGKEAVRGLGMSPKWEPGIQNHHKVRVQYVIPINFTLKG